MKDVEAKLIAELMKNSRRSDREIAKAIGSSQPTVSRMIKRLEKEGYIREYTMIPDFQKLGYELSAISFVKFSKMFSTNEVENTKKIVDDTFKDAAHEVIMIDRGTGLDFHGIFVSFHENYTAYVEFMDWMRKLMAPNVADVQSFIISLADPMHYRYLSLSTLGNHLLERQKNKKA